MKTPSSKASCKMSRGDSRNQYRAPVRIVLSYRTIDQFFSDIATNISLGGVFIKTSRPLPVGTTLRISFNIPQFQCYVEANGVVIHTGTPEFCGMGIKFSEIDSRALRIIDEMIKSDLCAAGKPKAAAPEGGGAKATPAAKKTSPSKKAAAKQAAKGASKKAAAAKKPKATALKRKKLVKAKKTTLKMNRR
jgi:uncharacterized protein (TIGR02266 family)